jgi:hypothetical protein
VVVSNSTQQADEEPAARQTIATLRLIDNALCATPS